MRSKGLMLVIAFLLALWAMPAVAQEQTGAIEGTVKDSSGAVLPGVTVEARSPAMVGVSTAVTDAQGVYRFPALPPGDYTVTANLQGFGAQKIVAHLVLGQILKVDIALAVAGVAETVQVTGEAPLIDTKQNATFSTIQEEAIARIPKGRDFTTILKTTAGTQDENRNGGTQVDGASGTENRFIVDGMDTTAMNDGSSGKTVLLDFIQEVQVKSSGYNAEFGGATGGVVSMITKSGSNVIRGQVGTYYRNASNAFWNGSPRAFNRYDPYSASATAQNKNYKVPDNSYSYISPLADVGGPIFKDRLWYYFGAGYTKNSSSEDVTFYGDPNRVQRHFDWWSDAKYFNYNLATQLSDKVRVKFSGQNQRDGNRGTAPGFQPQGYTFPDGTVATTPYTTSTFDKNSDGSINQSAFDARWKKTGQNSTNDVYSANADWVVTNTFFVNAAAGAYLNNTTTPPEFRGDQLRHVFGTANNDAAMIKAGFPTVPVAYQPQGGAANYADNISSTGTIRNKYQKTFVNANTSWFKSAAGQHTFKAGVRFERTVNDALIGASKPTVTLQWGQTATDAKGNSVAGKYGYYVINQNYTGGNVHSNNWAFWLQDSWNINSRLTVNYGVRAENEFLPAYNADLYPGAQSISYGFKDKLAPRAGFAYDIKGDGKWKAYGSFGHYYTITPLQLARGSMGGEHWIDYMYTLDTPDWASISCSAGPTGCPGTYLTKVDARMATNLPDPGYSAYFGIPNMTGIDPNIKPVKTGEITGGIDHELGPIMSIGLRYVHKWGIRAQDDVGVMLPGGDEYYVLTNPGEGTFKYMEPTLPNVAEASPKRNYDAVELRWRRRLSNNWSAEASYVWSRLFGNWSGLTSSDEPSTGSGGGRTGSPDATRYWDNLVMSYDSKGNQVYGLLATDRPHTIKLSGSYEFKTGTSLGAFWLAEAGTPQTTVMKFGQMTTRFSYPVYINGRNDLGRSPWLTQLDLLASQDVKFGKRMRAIIQLNIDNVFDQDKWTALYNIGGYGPDPYQDGVLMQLPNTNLPLLSGYDPAALSTAYVNGTAPFTKKGTHRNNDYYTTPNYFQGRRQARISVKFMF